ncbi:polyprenol dehydrogenase-like [Chironomus tepperi]|uniref:polyprenol dehydrogenase-like n=1 Tax=Chironomus tepperi TaxID=113505 RepID=UPI00391F7687
MNLLAAAFALLTPIPILLFYFFRSTKEFPKTWKEFKIEVRTILCGIRSQNEDFILRKRNRIKLESLPNKIAVITGGNRGIGLHVVKKLLRCEMKVVMGVRNPESSKKSVETAIGVDLCKNNITYLQCDTGDMESVRQFAAKVKQSFPAIHILINNAGVMATPYYETKDGFESQMAINYLGHFLLTHLLLPELIKGTESNDGKNVRVVNVSSCIHRVADMDYDDFNCKKYYYPTDAYGKSKLAQVYFTKYLEVIFKERGLKIQSHAPHPGIVNTDLFQYSSNTAIPWFKDVFYKTPESGSRTIVYAAISPYLEGKGGTYLSNCYYDKSHPKSKDFNEVKKLFDFTCQLLKIKSFGEF